MALICFGGVVVLFLVPIIPTVLFFIGISFLLAAIPSFRKIWIFRKIEKAKGKIQRIQKKTISKGEDVGKVIGKGTIKGGKFVEKKVVRGGKFVINTMGKNIMS